MTKNKQPIKAYNITVTGDDDAEINMHGEVVSNIPVDWWTGEREPGNFIALEEFLQDLETIKNKKNITVHINSPGGELYAGVAIYNRLKELSGTVITINDGLCASAASIIFQAGNIRRMNAGSNLMAHGVSGFLYGYYNVQDLKDIIKEFNAHNEAAMNIYMERSGKTKEEAKSLLSGDTWLTGQAAVDAGLADEVAGNDPIQMSMTADQKFLIVNSMTIPTNKLCSIPQGAKIINAALPQQVDANKKNGGNNMTLEELKNSYPDLIAEIENAARMTGAQQERARIQGIEEIENAIGDKESVKDAKYGQTMLTAEQLAFKAMQQQAQLGVNMLAQMQTDANDSGVQAVAAAPNNGNQVETKNEKEEIMDAINAYKKMKEGGMK